MKIFFLFASILALALTWAAADEAKSPTRTTVMGTFVSASGYTLAIETQAGNRMEFEVGSDSVIPAGLAAGTPVSVSYGPGETGVSHVFEVSRVNPPVRESSATRAPDGAPAPAVRERLAQDTTPGRPIQGETPKRKVPMLVIALVGILALGAVFAVIFLIRNRL